MQQWATTNHFNSIAQTCRAVQKFTIWLFISTLYQYINSPHLSITSSSWDYISLNTSFLQRGQFQLHGSLPTLSLRRKHSRRRNTRLHVPTEELTITSKVHVSLIIASRSGKLKLCQSSARIPELEMFMHLGEKGICIIQNWYIVQGKVTVKTEWNTLRWSLPF